MDVKMEETNCMRTLYVPQHWMQLVVLLSLFMSACSQQPGTHASGALLYQRYCASCHGVAGKGDGPLAASLRQIPADLTTLAQRAGGHFDEAAVMATIDGRRAVAAHGPREMPVWGTVFSEELKDQPYPQYTGLRQTQMLAQHLSTLQQR
jgi:mono/diheme cytochrome c family protein